MLARLVWLVAAAVLSIVQSLGAAEPPAAGKAANAPAAKTADSAPTALTWTQCSEAAEARIEKALHEPTELDFVDTPLADVLTFLAQRHKINITFDHRAMENAGIGTDTSITRSLRRASLRSALRLLLRDLGLAYVIQDEVLLVTTADEAQARLVLKVYDVADLAAVATEKNELAEDYSTLLEVVKSTIQPATWDEVGGPGSIVGATLGRAKVLVISQTRDVHEEIDDLLALVRNVGGKSPKAADRESAEAKILKALDSPTEMDFVDTPQGDVLDFLQDRHQINIAIDRKGMEDAGIATDTPITRSLKGLTLRSALRLLLRDLGLNYVIQDEVLLITTDDVAQSRLLVKVYEVADLAVVRIEKNELADDYDTLEAMITSTIQPSAWNQVGGPGGIVGATLGKAKLLVVLQTRDVLEEIDELLARVRSVGSNSPEGAPPPLRRKVPEKQASGQSR